MFDTQLLERGMGILPMRRSTDRPPHRRDVDATALANARILSRGFTLIELLVVIAILAVLIAILVPSLSRAREYAHTGRCLANLHGIGTGLTIYQSQNNDYVVPSYNMAGYDVTKMTYSGANARPNNVLDGWAAILDRDGVVRSSGGLTNNIFYCPDTVNDAGYNDAFYYDDTSPLGYFDWPATFSGPGGDKPPAGDPPTPLPIANFGDSNGLYVHEIRCSYWINANNPTGTTPPTAATTPYPLYYTQSVGYGPYLDGTTLPPVKAAFFLSPSTLVAATDGIYSGRQSKAQKGPHNTTSDASGAYRIGYRHGINNTATNLVFADGHAQTAQSSDMPPSASVADNSGPISFLVAP